MPEYHKYPSETEFKELYQEQREQVIKTLVLPHNSLSYGTDEMELDNAITNTVTLDNRIWTDISAHAIAKHAETDQYTPENISYADGASMMINQIALDTLLIYLFEDLRKILNQINKTNLLHLEFNALIKGLHTNPKQPSEILNNFNHCLAQQAQGEPIPDVTYNDLNEHHIRNLAALNPYNNHLIEALYTHFETEHDHFPDIHKN